MKLARLFTEHPASVGETYFQHLAMAFSFGARMVAAGCACLLHGLLPWLFTTTGSDAVRALHQRMVVNRARHDADRDARGSAADGSARRA